MMNLAGQAKDMKKVLERFRAIEDKVPMMHVIRGKVIETIGRIHRSSEMDESGYPEPLSKNLVLITSIIDPPNTPLSYTNTRNIYSKIERFEQTKKTIQSIKDKIPNCEIMIVECSNLSFEENHFFVKNTNYFLNLYNHDENIKKNIYSASKSLGEGTMTICALKYIDENNINYTSLIKISGRYWLSEHFNYAFFHNNNIVIKNIDGNHQNVFTALYKLPKKIVPYWLNFLQQSYIDMVNCIGYEIIFGKFILTLKEQNIDIIVLEKIGLSGNLSVSNEFYNG